MFLLSSLLNGVSLGMILFLVATGLSFIFGVMGILNLAHGALYMIGAYIGWYIAVQLGLNYWLAVLLGGVGAGLIGLVMERGLFHYLYKQANEQVLISFGLIYILTNIALWIWGPNSRAAFTAPILKRSLSFGDWSYPLSRIGIIVIGLIMFVAMYWLQNKTKIGAIIRAGMDDKETAMGVGINVDLVCMAVFFFSSFIAGFTGVIGCAFWGADLSFGIDILLLALVVVVIGGVGSIQGALLGGVLIGLIDAFGRALFPEFSMFTIYLAMVIVLLIRPTGILGRKI
jgi:branched-chain amino acid transport system permease protein